MISFTTNYFNLLVCIYDTYIMSNIRTKTIKNRREHTSAWTDEESAYNGFNPSGNRMKPFTFLLTNQVVHHVLLQPPLHCMYYIPSTWDGLEQNFVATLHKQHRTICRPLILRILGNFYNTNRLLLPLEIVYVRETPERSRTSLFTSTMEAADNNTDISFSMASMQGHHEHVIQLSNMYSWIFSSFFISLQLLK